MTCTNTDSCPQGSDVTINSTSFTFGSQTGYIRQGIATLVGSTVTLPSTPISYQALLLFQSGIPQRPIVDYTLSGNVVTFVTAPATGHVITYFYISNELGSSSVDDAIGTYKPWAGSDVNIPVGFLKCDGSSISRTDYAALFDVIGTTFGSVDANSFTLPTLTALFKDGAGALYEDTMLIRAF